MIDLTTISAEGLSQTQKNIRQQVIVRGWKAEIPYSGSSHYFLTRPDGKKLRVFSSMSPLTSYAAGSLANDKFAVHNLLEKTGVPQQDTIKVSSTDSSIAESIRFMNQKGRVVVKPIDGGHGRGITVGVTDEAGLRTAIDTAIQNTKSIKAALVQEQFEADEIFDLRVLLIGYQYIAALIRVPARVFGDGEHSIAELISIENSRERRGKPYHAELATIKLDLATAYLKDHINDVPASGLEVQVMGVANYGAGGETVDVTDDLPEWLVLYAETTARVCELEVAGVDFMMAKFPKPDMKESELRIAMTEINKAPLLTMHDNPTFGKSRNAVNSYMDYLETI